MGGSADTDPEGDEEDAMGITPAHLETDLVEAVVRMVPFGAHALAEDWMLHIRNQLFGLERLPAQKTPVQVLISRSIHSSLFISISRIAKSLSIK